MKSRLLRFAAAAFLSLGVFSTGSMLTAGTAGAAERGVCGGTFQPPCEVCVYVGTFPECVSIKASS